MIAGLALTVVGVLVIPFAIPAFVAALVLAVTGGYIALARSVGDRPIVSLTEASVGVLRGKREVRLLEPRAGRAVQKTRADAESWEGVDRGLFEVLREQPLNEEEPEYA